MFGELDLTRAVYITGEINEYSSSYVIDELLLLDKTSEGEINLIINSVGGLTISMFGIIDTIRVLKSKVNTIVLGEACSAASAIFVNGTGKRIMSENSRLMFHNISGGTIGGIETMKEVIKEAENVSERYLKTITDKIDMPEEAFMDKIYKKDYFVLSQEAIDNGMADVVLTKENKNELKLSEISLSSSMQDDISNIELIRIGTFKGNQYGEVNVTKSMLEDLVANFKSEVVGREISLDYTHENDSGEKKAGAWIKELSLKGSVVVANVEYTPTAKQMVEDKEYKYVSAEIHPFFENYEGKFFSNVLTGGTLTNRPVIKGLKPLKLSEKRKETEMSLKDFSKEEILTHLKDEHNIDVTSMGESLKLSEEKAKELANLKAEKETVEAELNGLKEKATLKAKQDSFDKLMKEGKVVKAQADKVMSKFATSDDMEEFYKEAPAVLKIKAKGSNSNGEGEMSEQKLKELASKLDLPVEKIKEQAKALGL